MAVEEYNSMASYYDAVLEPILWKLRKRIVRISGVEKGTKVLEIACGTGAQGMRFKKAGADYTGVDLSPAMLEVAGKRRLNCLHEDGTDLSLETGAFDIVTITLALHEVNPNVREGIMNEMIRLTREEGYLIIVDYTETSRRNLYSKLGYKAIHFIERLVGGSHYRNYKKFMSTGGLEKFLDPFGLEETYKEFTAGGNIGIIKLRKNRA